MSDVSSISMKHDECYVLCLADISRLDEESTQSLTVWCRKREFLGIQAELSRSWNIGSSICRYIPRIDEFTRRGQKMRFKCIQKTYFW
jgi:hypothetical protein